MRACRKLVNKAMALTTAQQIARLLIDEVPHLVKMDLTPFVKEIRIDPGCSTTAPGRRQPVFVTGLSRFLSWTWT